MLPIDPITKVMNQVVWRFDHAEMMRLESLFEMDPLQRIMTLMGLVTSVARRDKKVRDLLSAPGVVDGLKKMVSDRRTELVATVTEQEKPLA